jgi:hypothetical protein
VTLTGLPCHRGCTRRANGRNDACGGLAALLRLLGRGIRRPRAEMKARTPQPPAPAPVRQL